MSEKFGIDLRNLKIDQLGYVYKDIEKQAKIMEQVFNMPKFTFLPPSSQKIKYRGKDSEIVVKIAMSRFFNLQIELIEWIEGDCIYKEFLDQGKEGLQHISLFVDDLDKYVNYLKDLGFEIAHEGNIGNRYFYYFDTNNVLGFMLEVQASISRRRKKK